MGYCVDKGIPYSVFCGRTQEMGTPYWTDDDRQKVMAFLEFKAELCPRCGTRESDWVDDEKRFLDEPKYEAITHKCFGCSEINRISSTIPEGQTGVYAFLARYMGGELEVNRREAEKKQRELSADDLPGVF